MYIGGMPIRVSSPIEVVAVIHRGFPNKGNDGSLRTIRTCQAAGASLPCQTRDLIENNRFIRHWFCSSETLGFLVTGIPANLGILSTEISRTAIHVARLTRARLESLTESLLDRLEGPCRKALADSQLDTDEIDEIVMVGGMTRMPSVQERVARIFGK